MGQSRTGLISKLQKAHCNEPDKKIAEYVGHCERQFNRKNRGVNYAGTRPDLFLCGKYAYLYGKLDKVLTGCGVEQAPWLEVTYPLLCSRKKSLPLKYASGAPHLSEQCLAALKDAFAAIGERHCDPHEDHHQENMLRLQRARRIVPVVAQAHPNAAARLSQAIEKLADNLERQRTEVLTRRARGEVLACDVPKVRRDPVDASAAEGTGDVQHNKLNETAVTLLRKLGDAKVTPRKPKQAPADEANTPEATHCFEHREDRALHRDEGEQLSPHDLEEFEAYAAAIPQMLEKVAALVDALKAQKDSPVTLVREFVAVHLAAAIKDPEHPYIHYDAVQCMLLLAEDALGISPAPWRPLLDLVSGRSLNPPLSEFAAELPLTLLEALRETSTKLEADRIDCCAPEVLPEMVRLSDKQLMAHLNPAPRMTDPDDLRFQPILKAAASQELARREQARQADTLQYLRAYAGEGAPHPAPSAPPASP